MKEKDNINFTDQKFTLIPLTQHISLKNFLECSEKEKNLKFQFVTSWDEPNFILI